MYILSKDEGGRHTPFFKGYRPQFYFRTTDVTGTIELPEGVEMVMPGDNIKMVVTLIHPIAMDDGLRFAIREGGRTVGAGVVAKVRIARGYFSEDDFMNLTEWMDWSLADRDVDLDGIYFCPHHPEHGAPCDCRKPEPGMLLLAKQELNIDMSRSYMVGDKPSDLKAAINAGVGYKIMVRTGKPVTDAGVELADAIYDNLHDFAVAAPTAA